jgi:murein DD-endopeptidase MepM/ murein hydrolase activator NlpD
LRISSPVASLITLLLSFAAFAPLHAQPAAVSLNWQRFEQRVRDGKMSYKEGLKALSSWAQALEKNFPPEGFGTRLFFPLKGCTIRDVGGSHGDGFRPDGYRFLDGNFHRGHPAQDIFIVDKNLDGFDDATGRRAQVLAMADGVVLSTFTGWENNKQLRGGNYVWIYHPALRLLTYYAHLQDVTVGIGSKVSGGAPIATLGRSGKNAYPRRSPTHLHFMVLQLDGMKPVNPYPLLRDALTTPATRRLQAGSYPECPLTRSRGPKKSS